MKDNKSIALHVGVNIVDALAWADSKLDGMLTNTETGDVLSAKEVRDFFKAELNNGHMYFTACDKRLPDGSCAGHKAK